MRIFVILIAISLINSLKGQDEEKLFFVAGYGNYESAFVGLGLNLTPKLSASLSTGYQYNFKDHKQFSATFMFSRNVISIIEVIKLSVSPKLIYWNHEDEYFIFKSLAFAPDLEIEYNTFYSPMSIYFNAGPNINYQLKSTRKNQDVLGWPQKVALNWSIGARFKI